jgi:hypothetical protein
MYAKAGTLNNAKHTALLLMACLGVRLFLLVFTIFQITNIEEFIFESRFGWFRKLKTKWEVWARVDDRVSC